MRYFDADLGVIHLLELYSESLEENLRNMCFLPSLNITHINTRWYLTY